MPAKRTSHLKLVHKKDPPPPAEKPPRPERVILTAAEWDKRLAKLQKMHAKERREFERKSPTQLTVKDLRDEVVGIVKDTYGTGEDGWLRCQEAGGASAWTLRNWAMDVTQNPKMETIRRTLRACGRDLGVVSIRKR